DTGRPQLRADWNGPAELRIQGEVPEGMLVSLPINYDSGWGAWQDNTPVAVETDRIGFTVLRPHAATQTSLVMRYNGTGEQRVMAAVSLIAWTLALGAFLWSFRRPNAHA